MYSVIPKYLRTLDSKTFGQKKSCIHMHFLKSSAHAYYIKVAHKQNMFPQSLC